MTEKIEQKLLPIVSRMFNGLYHEQKIGLVGEITNQGSVSIVILDLGSNDLAKTQFKTTPVTGFIRMNTKDIEFAPGDFVMLSRNEQGKIRAITRFQSQSRLQNAVSSGELPFIDALEYFPIIETNGHSET